MAQRVFKKPNSMLFFLQDNICGLTAYHEQVFTRIIRLVKIVLKLTGIFFSFLFFF